MSVSAEVAANRRRWVEALESGEYSQAQGVLREGDGFCCLGLGCDVLGIGAWDRSVLMVGEGDRRYEMTPPEEFYVAVSLTPEHGEGSGPHNGDARTPGLTTLNDGAVGLALRPHSFAEIAAVLREWFGPDFINEVDA